MSGKLEGLPNISCIMINKGYRRTKSKYENTL